jgi:tetratricopeptide (TPR) repeat protein
MKWPRRFIPLLAIISPCACFAQTNRPARDPVQIAVTQAMRDGRQADAEKLLTDAIRELEQSDPKNPRLASYLKSLSQFADRRGSPSDAVALITRAYEIERNAYGPSDLRITNDLTLLASHAQMSGDIRETERLLDQALEIARSNVKNLNSGFDVGLVAGVFGSVATLYIKEQRWGEAESLMQEEAKLCEFFEEPYRDGYALCGSLAQRRAEVYRAEGRWVDADQVPDDKRGPPELDSLNKIAKKYEKDGLYPSAEDAYNRAIALAEKIEADPHNAYGGLIVEEINSLGQLFEKEGFKDRAEKTYERALEFDETRAGPERGRSSFAQMLNFQYLLDLYRKEGRLTDAERVVQRVLEIQERSLGRHRVVVQTLMTLAGLYEEEGKNAEANYSQALSFYQRALAIQEVNLGPSHPEVFYLLSKCADLLLKLHDDAKAAEVRARMALITHENEQK